MLRFIPSNISNSKCIKCPVWVMVYCWRSPPMTLCVTEIIPLHTEAGVYETQLCDRSYAGTDGEDFHVICNRHRNIWGKFTQPQRPAKWNQEAKSRTRGWGQKAEVLFSQQAESKPACSAGESCMWGKCRAIWQWTCGKQEFYYWVHLIASEWTCFE